ncbi:uncharacterized protein LOC116615621 [Nematostella vectensis]|uniref:uncharacterized protein LOC116615621 n=1 Tax=Nematostella vectensis TaxID=45351 RepID=UPI0020771AB7|nr:uncharacterized protein LOC116615621 [Nematostella vectensis]
MTSFEYVNIGPTIQQAWLTSTQSKSPIQSRLIRVIRNVHREGWKKSRDLIVLNCVLLAVIMLCAMLLIAVIFCRKAPRSRQIIDRDIERQSDSSLDPLIDRLVIESLENSYRVQKRRERSAKLKAELATINKQWFATYSDHSRWVSNDIQEMPTTDPESLGVGNCMTRNSKVSKHVRFNESTRIFFIENRKELKRLEKLGKRTSFKKALVYTSPSLPQIVIHQQPANQLPRAASALCASLPAITVPKTLQERRDIPPDSHQMRDRVGYLWPQPKRWTRHQEL